ncbi:MAG TPA: zf-HC2 domain-containing protein [Ktedonobacterales bacterium]|nr:zf-HC2 domain-containing protein [Ktedonobacterales bacterium]
MTCDDLLAYLSRYLDQELDAELATAARLHIQTCQNCQVILNTTQKVIVLGAEQRQRVIPQERREQLFGRLKDAFLQRPLPPTDGQGR